MGIISSLFKGSAGAAGSAARFGLNTNVGRIMLSTGVGAGIGFMQGDQYTSLNSRINRGAMGAVGGLAVGAGFNILTSRPAASIASRTARSVSSRASAFSKNVVDRARGAMRYGAIQLGERGHDIRHAAVLAAFGNGSWGEVAD